MGIFEQAQQIIINASLKNHYSIPPAAIASYSYFLREHLMDSHIGYMGPNGVGKSMAVASVLAETPDKIRAEDIIFPYIGVDDLIGRITSRSDRNFWLDEIGAFFPYKESMTRDQIELFKAIEVARSHRNAFHSCMRDVRRINNNYRNGKIALLIWLLDRDDDNPSTYAAVLLGNPFFETEDRFNLSMLGQTYDFNIMRKQIERLPSFVGYMHFSDVKRKVPKKMLDMYEAEKEAGIRFVGTRGMQRIAAKQDERDARQARLSEM